MKRASVLLLLALGIPLLGQTPPDPNENDGVKFVQHEVHSDADAAALEQLLIANPDDRATHLRLFGYYWSQAAFYNRKDVRHKLVAQADWFAVHAPQSAAFDQSAFALEKTDFDPPYSADLAIYKSHWKAAMESNSKDSRVFSHAFTALHAVDVQVPFLCSVQLRALMPTYPQFAVQMASYFAQFIASQPQPASSAGAPDKSAFTTLMNSNDSAVVGLTGQLLYGFARPNGKSEAYLPQAEALLKKAHELDPGNKRWVDALQSPPPASTEAAVAVVGTLTEADLWANGKVPPIEGSSDALVVDASSQAAKLSNPSAAFVKNVLSSTRLGPGNVRLKALLDEDGKVRALQFESGSVRLFPQALGMVNGWKYYPTISGANHVKVLTTIDLNYTAYVPPSPVMGGILGGVGVAGLGPDQLAKSVKVDLAPGVMEANVLSRTPPVYPAIAKAARIDGIVVLKAVISKTGTVDEVSVISGPPLLQQSAMDAVKTWTYKPYLLNGQPKSVTTLVHVVYSLQDKPSPAPPAAKAASPQ